MLFFEISRKRSRATQIALPDHMRDVSLRTYNKITTFVLRLSCTVIYFFLAKRYVYMFSVKKDMQPIRSALLLFKIKPGSPIYEIQ